MKEADTQQRGSRTQTNMPLQKGRDLSRWTTTLTYLAGVTPVQVLEEHQSAGSGTDERGSRNVHIYSAGQLGVHMDDATKIHLPRDLQTK